MLSSYINSENKLTFSVIFPEIHGLILNFSLSDPEKSLFAVTSDLYPNSNPGVQPLTDSKVYLG